MQVARSSKLQLSSNAIRKTFLDYFTSEKGHKFVRSSSVLPFGDPSLAFVNAGMNQFKNVLLGTALPPSSRVANSQKCVRVGGKHNDLAIVGRDGTHHTFFEMLGNWSFGDYFKTEACQMSWELLIKGYGLDPSDLHVTYFGGDPSLNLEPDFETRDIWRQIGVSKDRLLPGSVRDNFWEMGDTGPCGGCTEIHYLPKGEPLANLLEVWNLVFIEYNRESDGSLSKLGRRHVDTGMGFERLVAILQGHNSNYDTDLFSPLFRTIHSAAKCHEYQGRYGKDDTAGLDTAYRILADHTRMATVCLADGFFPDQEGKLRGIIRKALTVSREVFHKDCELLTDLSSVVADTLHDAYPEIARNLPRVHHILEQEAELLRALRKDTESEWKSLCQKRPELISLPVSECPNLLPAYKRLQTTLIAENAASGFLDTKLAWKMCETFGVPPHLAADLAKSLGLNLNEEALELEINKSKLESRKSMYEEDHSPRRGLSAVAVQELVEEGVAPTDDTHKQKYMQEFQETVSFPDQPASIVAMVVDDQLVDFVAPELLLAADSVGLILDRTNMYSEAGGQGNDLGTIKVEGGTELQVEDVVNSAGYVVHSVRCMSDPQEPLRLYNQCLVKVDEKRRRNLMNNHTGTHLLNAALRQILKLTDQKSSRVTPQKISFDFSVYKESLSLKDVKQVEDSVRKVILHGGYVRRRSVNSDDLISIDNLTVLPGETYNHGQVHIIEVPNPYYISREPCCGTHAVRSSDLEDFVIINFKSISSSVKNIQAVTGSYAQEARGNAEEYKKRLASLKLKVDAIINKKRNEVEVEACDVCFVELLTSLRNTTLLSFVVQEELTSEIEELRTRLKYSARDVLRSSMESEMKQIVADNKLPFLVHYLQCSSTLDNVPLQKATKLCPSIPSLLLTRSKGVVKARCNVPETFVNEKFSAQKWMNQVLIKLNAEGDPPRGQNPELVINMKGKKVNDEQLAAALKVAQDYAAHVFKL